MSCGLTFEASALAGTERVARAVAALIGPGDAVLLEGDLGAGKTTLTQMLARELGVTEPVTSPTFTLMHSYATAGGFDLLHVDVYRLERLSEVVDLALPELLDDGAAAVVEWGERAAGALAPQYLHISITAGEPESEARLIALHPVGERWQDRWERLAAALT
jgi:tRNA threonylcarbamoyladenosine biosynthesis protein TsaE